VIVVKIERWPDDVDPDDPGAARVRRTDIARAVIRNDHTGTPEHGNYDVRLYDPPAYNPWAGRTVTTRLEGFPRRELGAWDLVYRVLRELVGGRNEEASTRREPASGGDGAFG
jgi:hypothetical protein